MDQGEFHNVCNGNVANEKVFQYIAVILNNLWVKAINA